MRERLAKRIPASFLLFLAIAGVSGLAEWSTFPDRHRSIIAIDIVLLLMTVIALGVVRARRMWSTAVMVICTNVVAVALTTYHAVNGASAEWCLLTLTGLLATCALIFPWGARAQVTAGIAAVITYPMALEWGAVAALPAAPGMIFLGIVMGLTAVAAEVIWRYQERIDDLEDAERRIAQGKEELASREAQLRQIIDLVPHMIFAKDWDGNFLLVNEAVARAYGMSVDELTGLNHAAVHPDTAQVEIMLAGDREVMRSGQAMYVTENTFDDVSGAQHWLQAIKIPYVAYGTRGRAVLEVAVDVTELKRAEEGRRDLEMQVVQSQKLESLGVLAGGIAHDFNNLLVGILSNAGMALEHTSADAECRRFVVEIERAGRRASELCDQMLAYSGKGRLLLERFQPSTLVRETAELLEASISKKATLVIDCADDLPSVDGDVTQIRQVVMNLIINASDAIGKSNGTITLRTRVMEVDRAYLSTTTLGDGLPEGTYVCIDVSDTGGGMDEETKTRVFDPFFSTKFIGRGLGLSAVLGIVKGHRGTIEIDSQPGHGTTFRVLLPTDGRNVVAPAHVRPEEPIVRSAGERILVVDDEEMVRSVMKAALEQSGFDVIVAEDGRAALDLLNANGQDVQLLVLDLTMPRLDGEETIRELERVAPDLPVLLTSGYSEQDATSQVNGKSVVGFVKKPFHVNDLVSTVVAALAHNDHPGGLPE